MYRKQALIGAVTLALSWPAASQAPQVALAAPLPHDTPLIVDGELRVDAADFEGNILRIPESRRAGFRMSYERVASVIDGVYVARAVANKAREAGLDKDPAVQARLKQLQDAFLADLYVQHAEKQAAKAAGEPDFEQRARELYKAEPEKYQTDEEVRVQQILVGTKCRTKDKARELATKAWEEAKAPGADFLALAEKYTDAGDTIGQQRVGDLGTSPIKAFVPAVREVIKNMKPGEMSEPVESTFGYHVLKLVERKAPVLKPFEAVKDQIVAAERAKIQRKRIEDMVAEIRNSKTVITHRGNVEKLVAPGLDIEDLASKAREAHKRPATEDEKRTGFGKKAP